MRIGGDPAENPDWDRMVLLNHEYVGRVSFYSSGALEDNHWKWSAGTIPAGSGRAASMDEALQFLKAHVTANIRDGVVRMSGGYLDIVVADQP